MQRLTPSPPIGGRPAWYEYLVIFGLARLSPYSDSHSLAVTCLFAVLQVDFQGALCVRVCNIIFERVPGSIDMAIHDLR